MGIWRIETEKVLWKSRKGEEGWVFLELTREYGFGGYSKECNVRHV